MFDRLRRLFAGSLVMTTLGAAGVVAGLNAGMPSRAYADGCEDNYCDAAGNCQYLANVHYDCDETQHGCEESWCNDT